MARLIRRGDLSCRELMDAHLKRIARVNPRVNAIVTLLAEQALAEANKADETLASRGQVGPLHGLPIAHKDLLLTAGVRTTLGSPLFQNFIPNENAILADRVHAAGAIMVGKYARGHHLGEIAHGIAGAGLVELGNGLVHEALEGGHELADVGRREELAQFGAQA